MSAKRYDQPDCDEYVLRMKECADGDYVLHTDYAAAEKRIAELEAFVKSIRDGWDCDGGANGAHPNYCRCCAADRLLPEPIDAARENRGDE